MPIQTTAVTRLGISGGIWNRLGGDYSNKVASPPVFTGTIPDITGNEGDANIVTDLSSYFSGATSYSIAPTVEAGWNFDTITGILTVDTDAVGTFGTYVVTGTNAAGTDDSNAFSVIISAVEATQDVTGGFWFAYEKEQLRRAKERTKRRKAKEKARKIESELDKALALAQRELEEKEARDLELERLTTLVRKHKTEVTQISQRLEQVTDAAIQQETFAAMEIMDREIRKLKEEEDFLLMATEIILNG